MGADEHELEPAVFQSLRVDLVQQARVVEHRVEGDGAASGCPGDDVTDAVAGHREQPGVGVDGDALDRPVPHRPLEGIGQGVLRRGDIAATGGEQCQQPAVGGAGRVGGPPPASLRLTPSILRQ